MYWPTRSSRVTETRWPLRHQQKSRDLANALLDWREPDEIAIKLGNRRADIGVRLQRFEVNDLGRGRLKAGRGSGDAHRPSPFAAFAWLGL